MAWTTPGTAVAGDVLTAAFWNEQVRDNMADLRVYNQLKGYQTTTTAYTVSQTSAAAATDVFTSDISFTVATGEIYLFMWSFVYLFGPTAATSYFVALVDGSTSVADIGITRGDGANNYTPQSGAKIIAPSAGAKSYNIRAYKASGTNGTLEANANAPGSFGIFGPLRET